MRKWYVAVTSLFILTSVTICEPTFTERLFIKAGGVGLIYNDFMGMDSDGFGLGLGLTSRFGFCSRNRKRDFYILMTVIPLSNEQYRTTDIDRTTFVNRIDIHNGSYTGIDTIRYTHYLEDEYSRPVLDLGAGWSRKIRNIRIDFHTYATIGLARGTLTDSVLIFSKDGNDFTLIDTDVEQFKLNYFAELAGISAGVYYMVPHGEFGIDIAWYRDIQRIGISYLRIFRRNGAIGFRKK